MHLFYQADDLPVHSCLMLEDHQTAVDYPRRNLALGFCSLCGFIWNVAFDASVHEYSNRYEDQQSFSPRFRAFQTELISRLIRRYDLRGKDVLEIGCGKGDFLVELCRAGGNRGIGVDPACDPKRTGEHDGCQVSFIPDFYSDAYSSIHSDFVCCRHTLEHIHPTDGFIRMLRRAIGDRRELVVFFEVPDVLGVLRARAFWDIYYEHCSYFSVGSLAKVFRANSFDIVELAKDYDGQYILLTARPTEGATAPSLPEEDDLASLSHEVDGFERDVRGRVDRWRLELSRLKAAGRRVAVWGSGSKCVGFLSTLQADENVYCVVDINPHRHGKFLPGSGKRVLPPGCLAEVRPDVILVMNPIYCTEIRRDVDKMGISAEVVTV